MGLVTVALDRVFDVHAGYRLKKRVTFFSFESGNLIARQVPSPGGDVPKQGQTIAAYLENDDDWCSLIGWRDLQSSQSVVESDFLEYLAVAWAWTLTMYSRYNAASSTKAGAWQLLGLVAVFITVTALRSVFRIRRAKRALHSLALH